MKRRFSLAVILLAVLVLLAGCGGQSAEKSGSAAQDAQEPIKLRIVTEYSLGDKRGQIIQSFADQVNQDTNGRVLIEIYPDGQLFKSDAHYEAVSAGSVEMAVTHFGKGWPQIIPEITIMGAGVFEDSTHALKALNGPLGDKLSQLLEEKANTKLLAWTGAGNVDAMGCRSMQITKPEDLKGLRMRVPNASQSALVEALGGAPALINPSEAYLALQRGTIDGVFSTTPSGVVHSKLYEVAEYWTRISISLGLEHGFVINQDTWEKIPADIQQVIARAAQEKGKSLVTDLEAVADQEWAEVEKAGAQVYVVPREEVAKWRTLLAPARTATLEKILPKETVTELLELAASAK